jgi:hypothetical protein
MVEAEAAVDTAAVADMAAVTAADTVGWEVATHSTAKVSLAASATRSAAPQA